MTQVYQLYSMYLIAYQEAINCIVSLVNHSAFTYFVALLRDMLMLSLAMASCAFLPDLLLGSDAFVAG